MKLYTQDIRNIVISSQQQNALGYNLSMQGTGAAAIDGPRFEEFGGLARIFLRSGKGGSRKVVSQGFCCWVAQLGYSRLRREEFLL